MKIVAYIPIKLNNERLPGKNLKRFYDGTPLIHFVQNTLLRCNNIDEIYVFCSEEAIQPYLLNEVKFLKRDKKLDTKETLCGEIIYNFMQAVDADIYVLAHATSPFVQIETYNNCIDAVKNKGFLSAIAAKKLNNFIWFQNKPLNFSLDKAPRTQDITPGFLEISSPYVFTKQAFLQFKGRTSDKPFIHSCSDIEAIDIDYPEDFEFADMIYKYFIKKDLQ
ncbi:TPA: hypothetical protein R5A90_001640 [Campylobacter jejuni]|nr:hypothetical protein [Campylobacter jejuni]